MALKEQDIVFTTQDENGNTVIQMPITRLENVEGLEGLLDLIHPVGSLYWSKKSTNPATLFGGSWTQVKDKFILAAGSTYSVGATGGAATVTLTTNQIPSHSHTGTAASDGSHTHTITRAFRYGADPSTGNTTAAWDMGDRSVSTNVSVTSSSSGSHTHTLTINSTGGGAAHENMPPYVAYYCWERTA